MLKSDDDDGKEEKKPIKEGLGPKAPALLLPQLELPSLSSSSSSKAPNNQKKTPREIEEEEARGGGGTLGSRLPPPLRPRASRSTRAGLTQAVESTLKVSDAESRLHPFSKHRQIKSNLNSRTLGLERRSTRTTSGSRWWYERSNANVDSAPGA